VLVLATLIGCSSNSIPDHIVIEQVKSCLETKRLGDTKFPERFTIQDVSVKNRLVRDGEAKVAVVVSVLLNQDYDAVSSQDHAWSTWVGGTSGRKGEIITNDNLEVQFKEIDSGWQIQCDRYRDPAP
jgi:hypothetical protein